MVPLVLARFVEVPVRIEVAAGSQRPQLQDRLGANQPPAGAGQLRERIEAATASRELAEQQLQAEESKFEVGLSTNFFVLQSQRAARRRQRPCPPDVDPKDNLLTSDRFGTRLIENR